MTKIAYVKDGGPAANNRRGGNDNAGLNQGGSHRYGYVVAGIGYCGVSSQLVVTQLGISSHAGQAGKLASMGRFELRQRPLNQGGRVYRLVILKGVGNGPNEQLPFRFVAGSHSGLKTPGKQVTKFRIFLYAIQQKVSTAHDVGYLNYRLASPITLTSDDCLNDCL